MDLAAFDPLALERKDLKTRDLSIFVRHGEELEISTFRCSLSFSHITMILICITFVTSKQKNSIILIVSPIFIIEEYNIPDNMSITALSYLCIIINF